MLKNVPLFGIGVKGKSPNVCAQDRVNLYVEFQEDPEANGLCMFPTPGLTTFVNFGANPSRGAYTKDSLQYIVNRGTLWEVQADGTSTSRGTLLTTGGRVDMADNGDELLIVDGTTTAYVFTFATLAFAQVVLPQAVDTCDFLDGYFLAQGTTTGQCLYSGLYDGLTWNALDFFTAESNPDNLVRVFVDNGLIGLYGVFTTEFWGNSGAADLPFARIGASAIEWGLAARWSLVKFDGSVMFLRRNRLGAVQVCRMAGNEAVPVSTPELDYLLSTYTSVENASAFSYMVSGHPMYQISFPSADVTWVYDGKSNEWHRAQYGADGRHRGEIQVNFLNRPYVTDYENGKVYLLDQTVYTDDGEYIVREWVSRHNATGDYSQIAQLWLEMEAGTGLVSGQGSDPQVMLRISRDGGHTFGAEVWRGFGQIGQYTKRAVWNALGRARNWTFKFRVTDPVKCVFVAAWARVSK
jgi:hypothetical protein